MTRDSERHAPLVILGPVWGCHAPSNPMSFHRHGIADMLDIES